MSLEKRTKIIYQLNFFFHFFFFLQTKYKQKKMILS